MLVDDEERGLRGGAVAFWRHGGGERNGDE